MCFTTGAEYVRILFDSHLDFLMITPLGSCNSHKYLCQILPHFTNSSLSLPVVLGRFFFGQPLLHI